MRLWIPAAALVLTQAIAPTAAQDDSNEVCHADRDAVARYLKDHDVHFFVQDRSVGGERYFDREDVAGLRAIAGDLFLGIHWGELDSSGMVPENYLPKDVL